MEVFIKKNCRNVAKKKSEFKMYLKKSDKLMANGKDTTIRFIVGLTKKILNEIPSYKNESILS